MSKVRKFILSLDGGGFRGLSSLIVLHHIMRMLVDDLDYEPVPAPCQIFDLICGTSMGGIIAILLGRLGLDCLKAISVFRELGLRMFSGDEGKTWMDILAGEQFPSAEFEAFLEEVVDRYTGNRNTTMKIRKGERDAIEHPSTDVFVLTVPAGGAADSIEPFRLRSYATPRGGTDALSDHTWTICQAARATSAAPIYFAPLQIGSQAFQDASSSRFNNPTKEALQEADLRSSTKPIEFVVVSIGTGLASLIRDNQEIPLGLRDKLSAVNNFDSVSKQLSSVARDTELTHLEIARRFDLWKRPDDYFRLNPPQGLGDLDFADHKSEGAILEVTNVWLRSPDGRDSTLAVYEKIKPAYKTRTDRSAST